MESSLVSDKSEEKTARNVKSQAFWFITAGVMFSTIAIAATIGMWR